MFVYILKSIKFKKTYTGITKDIERRIKEHNWGTSLYIKKYRPWVIIHSERADSSTKARKREKYLKSAAGRKWIKKYLFSCPPQ